MTLNQLTFVAVDTETTGVSPRYGHRLVEVGAVRFTMAGVVETWETTLWPHRPISAGAQAVHGLSAERLHDAPCWEDVADEFLDFVGGSALVMHNAPFDASFLAVHLAESGHHWSPPIYDTLRLLRRHFRLPSNSLGPAVRHFGIARSPNHRAAADATATADLFRVLLQQLAPRSLAELAQLHGSPARLPEVSLPCCDTRLAEAARLRHPVAVRYASSARPFHGHIEGIANSERGDGYCTLRVASGKRLHLAQQRILAVEPL